MSDKKNNLMPMMSIIGIVLVVLGHSGYAGTNIAEDYPYLFQWIYNFHMPLFFFISGFLFSLTNESFIEMDKKKLVKKKVQRLLVPYLVLGVVLWGIKYVFSSFASVNRQFSITSFFEMFIAPNTEGSTMGYLWYLITLFMVFVLMAILPVLHVDMKKSKWCLIVIVTSWLLWQWGGNIDWFNMRAVLWYMPFFVIGIQYKKYEVVVQRIINRGEYFNVSLSIVLSVLFILLPSSTFFAYNVIVALVGIWMTLSICSSLIKRDWVVNHILSYGRYTYSIYLLSWFGQYATKFIAVNILHLHITICIVLLFFMGLIVPIATDKAIDRLDNGRKCKWLRLIIGY